MSAFKPILLSLALLFSLSEARQAMWEARAAYKAGQITETEYLAVIDRAERLAIEALQ